MQDDGAVPEDLADEQTYEQHTRSHYQDPAVARRYTNRQSFARSPAEWLVGVLEKQRVRRGLHLLGSRSMWRILDVPAGSGKLRRLLTDNSSFYCATDISMAMLRLGQERASVVGDATALPFHSGAFDVVVCLRLLHRVPEIVIAAAISNSIQASRIGVVLSYASEPRFPMLHRTIQRLARRTGQRTTRVTPTNVSQIARAHGARVLLDRSISFGLTAERVAVLTRLPA